MQQASWYWLNMLLFLALGLVSAVAVGSPPCGVLHCEVSAHAVRLDEQLAVRLEAAVPEGYEWDIESLHAGLDLFQGGEGRFTLVDQQLTGAEGRLVAEFLLEPWNTGTSYLAFLPAQLRSPQGPPINVFSDVYTVAISPPRVGEVPSPQEALPLANRPSLVLNTTNQEELESEAVQMQTSGLGKRRFLRRFLLVLAAVILGFAVCSRGFPKRKRRLPSIDHHKVALEALARLEARNLPEQELFETFYVAITAIVRTFVEECYSIHAPEQTTEEFLREATAHNAFTPTTKGLLREFLSLADLVKFARHHPSLEQCQEAVSAAYALIR